MTYSFSGALYWMKRLFIIEVNFINNGYYLSSELFLTLPRSNTFFFHNCTGKNLVLRACFYWDGTISLREVDQKFLLCGKIGYGDSYLDSVFRYSKVFRLLAILHDAAGAVRLQTGKEPGYC